MKSYHIFLYYNSNFTDGITSPINDSIAVFNWLVYKIPSQLYDHAFNHSLAPALLYQNIGYAEQFCLIHTCIIIFFIRDQYTMFIKNIN
jgi:hypothetical protein